MRLALWHVILGMVSSCCSVPQIFFNFPSLGRVVRCFPTCLMTTWIIAVVKLTDCIFRSTAMRQSRISTYCSQQQQQRRAIFVLSAG
ncbi:hypothetical protein V8E52_010303 [Russula decolorans]